MLLIYVLIRPCPVLELSVKFHQCEILLVCIIFFFIFKILMNVEQEITIVQDNTRNVTTFEVVTNVVVLVMVIIE